MAIDAGVVATTAAGAALTKRYLDRRADTKSVEAAVELVDRVTEERARAREAGTPREQLAHERQARDLERQLGKAVRTMSPRARRDFERGQQAIERTRGLEHTR